MPNDDLISRKALLEIYKKWLPQLTKPEDAGDRNGVETSIAVLEEAPAIDAEPVRHGRYEFIGMDMLAGTRSFRFGTCSECKQRINFAYKHNKYCPNCGAKMDLKEDG